MIHLRSVRRLAGFGEDGRFPFDLPVIRSLSELQFTAPVTLFVGENGSGKSTLLEALACAAGSITVGSENAAVDRTLEPIRRLAQALRLVWNRRTRKGFFLRAEDFFGYVKRIAAVRSEMQAGLTAVDEEYRGRSPLAHDLAKMPYHSQLQALDERYGPGLDARSHGESFLALFQARFVPGGLYLLDEPEAPLSPLSQLGLVAMLHSMVEQDAQFIIATHSPILMAFPTASIYDFDQQPLRLARFEDLPQVNLLRDFLNHPETYLRHLEKGTSHD